MCGSLILSGLVIFYPHTLFHSTLHNIIPRRSNNHLNVYNLFITEEQRGSHTFLKSFELPDNEFFFCFFLLPRSNVRYIATVKPR